MKMKKFKSFAALLMIFALFFVGCEDDGPSTKSLLLGKWQINSISMSAYIGGALIATESETFDTNELVIEFVDGGTGIVYNYGEIDDTFTWSLDGKKMTFPPFGMDPVQGTVNVTKTTLKVTWEEEETYDQITYTIEYVINGVKVN